MCHENDHLNGVLYTDIATDIMTLEEATRLAEQQTNTEEIIKDKK